MSWIPATGDMTELREHISRRLIAMIAEREQQKMAKRYVVTNANGAGASFKTKAEADAFTQANSGYQLESDEPETETKAVKATEVEDKAVKQPTNKSRG